MQRTECHEPQATSHARAFDPASKHLIGKDEIVRAETTIDIQTNRTPRDIMPEQQSANRRGRPRTLILMQVMPNALLMLLLAVPDAR